MALTADANTPERTGDQVSRPAEAATKLYGGSIGAVNAAGNAVPAANTAGLKVVGRVQSQVDNSAGAAGDLNATMKRGCFRYANSGTSALTVADIGGRALVEDDGTVAKVTTNSIDAGKIIDIDASGVWVDHKS